MGHIFGKPKAKKPNLPIVTEQDKAILKIKQQRDSLKKYQKRIIQDLEKEREIAKQLLKDNKKEKALKLLKKKKFMESVLEKTDNQLTNLEQLMTNIEFSQIESKVLEGLETGNQALKQLHDIMSIDRIESILEETKEGIEKQQEIDDMLLGINVQTDDESLLQELEQMFEQKVPQLPEVPQNEPVVLEPERVEISKEKSKESKEAVLAS